MINLNIRGEPMANILVVEDDRILCDGIEFALKKDNYLVYKSYTIKEARKIIINNNIDLILLDINLPDGNGIDFCVEIRKNYSCPIVFFTANDTEADMVEGFKAGCDDYISKPFSTKVIKYKLNAILRRNEDERYRFEYKNITIDYNNMTVKKNDEIIKFTNTEYKLIELFAKHKGQVMTKEVLLENLWDMNGNFVNENTLSVNIRRIRKKIEEDIRNPQYIKTVFGIGYVLGE